MARSREKELTNDECNRGFDFMLQHCVHGKVRRGDFKEAMAEFSLCRMLLFYKGSPTSAYLMLQWLSLFSESSSLKANNSKSALYYTGIPKQEAKRIQRFLSSKECLPFRYLGVSISSKKIKAADCDVLIDNMVAGIRAQLMLLWSGKASDMKSGYVKWAYICTPNKQGGLSFRDIKSWNKADVGKLIWHIGISKDDLRIMWIHEVYIKTQNWWDFKAPPSASWVVKYLCTVKDDLKAEALAYLELG